METELKEVHEHMLRLGLGALAHANWHSNFDNYENHFWPELSVLQAAHAAEILIKARIAQEHPLLIFEQLPKLDNSTQALLSIDQLMENGRTYQYADLPGRLWATTGIRIPNLQKFQSFGRLRNTIQHFASPNKNCSFEAVNFIYEVIDPFINQCWGLFAVDYIDWDYDDVEKGYLVEGLIRSGVRFLISGKLAREIADGDFEWPEGDDAYKQEMEARFEASVSTTRRD
jgi:hypothetical protein